MDRHHGIAVTARELLGHGAAPVPAMRPVFFIAEDIRHQLRPQIIHAKDRSDLLGPVGKTVAGQVGHDDIKSVFNLPKCRGVGEHWNYFYETIKRIRIAVGQDERKRSRSLPALIDEVDADIIELGLEMCELIQRRLLLAPV